MRRLTLLLAGAALLLACAGRMPEIPYRPPRIGIVLGGGAARGFAHVGVLRALEEAQVPMHLIVGTSVGAVMGALYADSRSALELERLAYTIGKDDIFDFSILSLDKRGLASGDGLVKVLEENIRADSIEKLSIPFAAVAVDLDTGERIVFDRGPVSRAVRASASIPGVFVPVAMPDGRTLVDGGVAGNLAADVAWDKGADIIIAVDIGQTIAPAESDDMIATALQSISIMGREIDRYKKNYADIVIRPAVGDVGMLDFGSKKKCIAAGEAAARGKLPSIRRLIADWERAHGKPGARH